MTRKYVILTQAGIDYIVNEKLKGFDASVVDSWRGNNLYYIKGDTNTLEREKKLKYPIQVEGQIYNWIWLNAEYFVFADEYKTEIEKIIKALEL